MRRSRLVKYLKNGKIPKARSVVISDIEKHCVYLSFGGEKLVWLWDSGLVCPGNNIPYQVHPLAAEALVIEEIMAFIRLEGLEDNTIFVNSSGEKLKGIVFNPPELGVINYEIALKKEKIKELYEKFVYDGDRISEEMIGEAISFGVLSPFLSLVNL